MYSKNDLNLVSSSIPIYTKADLKGKRKTPKRGHFGCSGCDAGRLSGTRTYITALVYNFDLIGPCFAFLFSRADTHYAPPNDAFTQLMATTINYDWVYRAKDKVRNTEIHVRGWWNLQRKGVDFKHKNGVINLGDHVNFDNPDRDGDNIINPEFGIKMFIAPYAGMYRSPKHLDSIGTWNEEETYRNTFVHPGTDHLAKVMNPKWKRYEENKLNKKSKHTRRRRNGQEIDEAIEPQFQTIEEREATLAARQQATRPRRTGRGAAQGRITNERGRLRFTEAEMGEDVQAPPPDPQRWVTEAEIRQAGEGTIHDIQPIMPDTTDGIAPNVRGLQDIIPQDINAPEGVEL